MTRSNFALTLALGLSLTGLAGGAEAADKTATTVFVRGMTEVCTPWQAGAEQKPLFASLKAAGWNVDLLPKLDGPWGSAMFQVRKYDANRGCNAMLTIATESDKSAVSKAAIDWVNRTYPDMPMIHDNKAVQLKTGPVHAWTWADETTSITFYAADSVADAGPHVVLSIKPK